MLHFRIVPLFFLLLCSTAGAQDLGSWQRIDNRSTFDLWDVTFTDSLSGWAVGDYGVILHSTDGGRSWTQKLSPDQFALRNVHFFDDSTGIAAGFRGSCVRTTDAGAHWESIPLGTDATLPGMAAVGATVWLSGADGTILKSTDRGRTWKTLRSGTDLMLDAISFSDAQHGMASSVQRILLQTSDGGATWEDISFDTFVAVTDVDVRPGGDCWLVGYHGLVMHSTDDGASWMTVDAYRTDYVQVAFDRRGSGWAVGKRGAVIHATEGGMKWRLQDLTAASSLNAVTFLPNNSAVAVGEAGAIYRLPEVYPPATDTAPGSTD